MLGGKRLFQKLAPLSSYIQAVSHIDRLAILCILTEESREPWQIAETLHKPQNRISHHLKLLVKAGWILRSRYGKRVEYTINEKAVKEVKKFVRDSEFGEFIAKIS